MSWHYADASKQQIAFDISKLNDFIQAGTIQPTTLIWNQDMTDWQAAQELFPDHFSAVQAAAPAEEVAVATPVATQTGRLSTGGATLSAPQTGGSALATQSSATQTSPAATAGDDAVARLAALLASHAGWIKFVGIMMIIAGIGSIFYLIGILPLLGGLALLKVSNAAKQAQMSQSEADLNMAITELNKYFKMTGIAMIIWLVLMVILVILYFVVFAALIAGAAGAASAFLLQLV